MYKTIITESIIHITIVTDSNIIKTSDDKLINYMTVQGIDPDITGITHYYEHHNISYVEWDS